MANSIITRLSNGSDMQFSLNFTLGILKRTDVVARVGDEVDGGGDPVYRDIEWITDGLVNVLGAQAALDVPVVFTRTVRKDQLQHDYSNGSAIDEENLDESNKQTLMAVHEVLDGRFPEGLAQDLNMNGFRVINMAPGEDPDDAVTFEQLGTTVADTAANAALALASANAAAVSEDNAADSEAAADADATQTALDRIATAADRVQTGSDKVATAADRVQTGLDKVATAADRVQTGLDKVSATASASTATTQAGIATTQATTATNAANAAGAAQALAEAARDTTLAAFDAFDDRYLGTKSSDPTLDNDGNALVAGALYFNSVDGAMKVYTGSIWVAAYVSGGSFYAIANNLSEITNTGTAQTNLGASTIGKTIFTAASAAAVRTAIALVPNTNVYVPAGTDVAVADGGTNISSYAVGDMLYASATGVLSKLADVATGNALISGGVNTAPSYGKIGLTTHVSGILPVANGGTNNAFFTIAGPATSAKTYTVPNATCNILTDNAAVTAAQGGTGIASYTQGDILYATGTTTLAKLAKGTALQQLRMNSGATAPEWFTATRYASAAQVFTAGTTLTLAHGLGAEPNCVQFVIQCSTAELGYSVGDRVLVNYSDCGSSGSDMGFAAQVDATNITVRVSTAGNLIIARKDNNVLASITIANWRLYVKASI